MKYKCSICGLSKEQGFFNHTNKFICRNCEHLGHSLLFNTFQIVNGELIESDPFHSANGRDRFIDYAYTLFNNKLSTQAYVLVSKYAKEYSYIGMARALEYFYIIKKNDKKKAKNNIGIIPYVYEEAQKFYKINNDQRRKNYLVNIERMEQAESAKKTELEVKKQEQKKYSIDLNSL